MWRDVLWPRVRPAALAGAAWVAVQALTESAVTDVTMVRTFAEEVYFQLVGNPAGVSAAVAVTLPVWLASIALAVMLLKRAAAVRGEVAERPRHAASRTSVPATAALWFGVIVLVGVPVVALAARTVGVRQLLAVAGAHGGSLVASLIWAAVAGASRGGAGARGVLACAAFAAVGLAPARTDGGRVGDAALAGLGLKTLVGWLVSLEDAILGRDFAFPPIRSLLYDQPSPLPEVWALALRFFPLAVAVLWPRVWAVPRELIDAATLDGGPRAVWRVAVWPCVRGAFVAAVAAVAVLAMGEVVASKLVQPPGRHTFAQELFDEMFDGADATVAAMCLLQLAATAALAAACVAVVRKRGLARP